MTCENCWNDAYAEALGDTSKTQTEHYREIVDARNHDERGGLAVCLEAEQKGRSAAVGVRQLFGAPMVESDEVPKGDDVHFGDWSDYFPRQKGSKTP